MFSPNKTFIRKIYYTDSLDYSAIQWDWCDSKNMILWDESLNEVKDCQSQYSSKYDVFKITKDSLWLQGNIINADYESYEFVKLYRVN